MRMPLHIAVNSESVFSLLETKLMGEAKYDAIELNMSLTCSVSCFFC